ncbi:MAG: SDR family oxidoreductase, partial [Chloroflexota bacterium]
MKNENSDLILVTGATGYIGGRLIPRLLEAGYRVRAMTRNTSRLNGRSWCDDVEVVEADALDSKSLPAAFEGVSSAYYLLHSMQSGENFHAHDVEAAHNMGRAAKEAGVDRIIYLGGLGDEDADLSEHLKSRQKVGNILHSYAVDVTEFRAALIIGSGSVAFEMVRYLTERLPIMVSPRWITTKIQPIAIDDALEYLVCALEVEESRNHIIEIGGTDIMTYETMMQEYARLRDLNRTILKVPVLTPRLSSFWVHLVTPIPATIARPLIDGLRDEVVVNIQTAKHIFPDIKPMSYHRAVGRALSNLKASKIETTWSDAIASVSADGEPYEFVEEQGMMLERRQRDIQATPEKVFEAVSRIGGSTGWLYLSWLWTARSILDRLMGGVGSRGGRRDPNNLRTGDVLDFWRVEELKTNEYLRLRAEMKLPGRGWLEFDIEDCEDGTSKLTQTAYFASHGFWGFAYWFAMFIPHKFIFDGMIDALVEEAETEEVLYPGKS